MAEAFQRDMLRARAQRARRVKIRDRCYIDSKIILSHSMGNNHWKVLEALDDPESLSTETDNDLLITVEKLKGRIADKLKIAHGNVERKAVIDEHWRLIDALLDRYFAGSMSEEVEKEMAAEEEDIKRMLNRAELISWDGPDAALIPTPAEEIATMRLFRVEYQKLYTAYIEEKDKQFALRIAAEREAGRTEGNKSPALDRPNALHYGGVQEQKR